MKQSTIDAINYLLSISESGAIGAIRETCDKEKLNEDFIREFRKYITPEMFSLSPSLDYSLIADNQDLFDIEIWKTNPSRSLELLKYRNFRNMLSDEEVVKAVSESKRCKMDWELFSEIFDSVPDSSLKSILLELYPNEFPKEFILKNSKYFSSKFLLNKNHAAEMSISDIEALMPGRDIEFFTYALLAKPKNIGWHKRVIEDAISGKLELLPDSGTHDAAILRGISELHPSLISSYICCAMRYGKNSLSYTILHELLNKELPESLISMMAYDIRKAGMINDYAKYCDERNFVEAKNEITGGK